MAEIGHKSHQRNTIQEEIISVDKNNNSFSSPFNGSRKIDQSVSQLPKAQQNSAGKVLAEIQKQGPIKVIARQMSDQANRVVQDEAEKALLDL